MENYQKDLTDKIVKEAHEIREPRTESRSGRMLAGLIVVVVGSLLLARQAGMDVPWWLFSWKMLLIAVGLFVGAKHSFRGFGWLIPILIGCAFLIEDFMPELSFREYLWPIVIIVVGLFMIIRPRRQRRRFRWDRTAARSSDDVVDSVSIFGGTKKIIISKDFKGGDITTFFGATDLDLMQADIKGTVTIDVTQVFGGTKLIIPSHWNIKSDVVCIFGSIEDKRSQMKEVSDPSKILKLDGTCIFGGIEIKNY